MTHYGTWISYGGTARIALAVVLMAAAGGVAFAGMRLRRPFRPTRPGEAARTVRVVTWLVAIAALLVCVAAYAKQALREHLLHAPPADPITPVTVICAGLVFFILAVGNSSRGWRVSLASAALGAASAPMIFELPFDLIVMTRTYPAIPPDPALYRVLFFAPLFLVEITTLWLLPLSPVFRVSKAALFFFASMLATFAVWGLFGFGYPSSPVPFALNVVSKILAFAVALSLLLPQRAEAGAPDRMAGAHRGRSYGGTFQRISGY